MADEKRFMIVTPIGVHLGIHRDLKSDEVIKTLPDISPKQEDSWDYKSDLLDFIGDADVAMDISVFHNRLGQYMIVRTR